MMKKIISIALILIIVALSFQGCQKNQTEHSVPGNSDQTETNESTVTETRDQTEPGNYTDLSDEELTELLINAAVISEPENKNIIQPERPEPEDPEKTISIGGSFRSSGIGDNIYSADIIGLFSVIEERDGFYNHPEAKEHYEKTGEMIRSVWVYPYIMKPEKIFYDGIGIDTDAVEICNYGDEDFSYYPDNVRISNNMHREPKYMKKGVTYLLFLSKNTEDTDYVLSIGWGSEFVPVSDILGSEYDPDGVRYFNGNVLVDITEMDALISEYK